MKSRTILMVCDTFPPDAYVGGLRPGMFSKYLPQYGWQPLVLTRSLPADDPDYSPSLLVDGLPDHARVIRVPFGTRGQDLGAARRRLRTRLRCLVRPEVAHPPGVYDGMARQAHALLRDAYYDAVWATVPDLWPLRLAAELADSRKVPWVADLRDISEQEDGEHGGLRARFLHHRVRWRRRQLLRSASAVVTVSQNHAEVLAKHNGRSVRVIPNGFDPEMFPRRENAKPSPRFSVVYMGRILSAWLQEPRSLFAAMDRMLDSSEINAKHLDVSFYGTEARVLGDLAAPFRSRSLIQAKPRIPYDRVPGVLRRSCVLLLLTNRGRHGILTTKLFEYLGARRPVLCVPGDGGELDALIAEAEAGLSCSTVDAVGKALSDWYREWCATGTVSSHGREQVIMRYSRERQAGELAGILDSVVSGHGAAVAAR